MRVRRPDAAELDETRTVYTLDYREPYIVATGPENLLTKLHQLPGAVIRYERVALPTSRTAILCVESIASAEVTDQYKALRRTFLRPSKENLREVETRFNRTSGGDVPSLLLHQWEYLAHSWSKVASFNASEQGLGKTRMTLALMRIWGCNRVLILLPKDLAMQWEEELLAIWPDPADRPRFVNCTQGKLEDRANLIRANLPSGDYINKHPLILAVNYEAVAFLEPYLKAFWADLTICDESWKIKNHTAKVTKAAIRLADHSRAHYATKIRVPRTIALAGTPVGNDIGDLWSQLRFLGKTYVSDSYARFLQTYAVLKALHLPGRTVLQPVGVADPAGLMLRLDPVWFRATKRTCLSLPEKIKRRVLLDLPRATRRLYEEVKKDGEAALGDDRSLAGRAVVTMRLQQITGGHHPEQADGGEEEAEGSWTLKPIPSCPKIEWLQGWAEINLLPHPQTRCIVWCQFRAEVKRIAEVLGDLLGDHRVHIAVGGVSSDTLNQTKASFNSRNPEGVQVIVATTKRLAYGHNLQAADFMVYFSGSWSYIEHAQSEDRAHRFGRDGDVNYLHLIVRNSVDEEIFAALACHTDLATRLAPCVATTRRATEVPQEEPHKLQEPTG